MRAAQQVIENLFSLATATRTARGSHQPQRLLGVARVLGLGSATLMASQEVAGHVGTWLLISSAPWNASLALTT